LRSRCDYSEKDGCSEDPFECVDQPTVLLAPGLHSKCVQHLSGRAEADRLTFLLNRQGSQEDRYEPVLTERHTELWMTSHVEHEPAISAFIQQPVFWKTTDRKAAQDERTRTEAKRLTSLVSVLPDQLYSLDLLELLLGYNQVFAGLPKDRTRALKTRWMRLARSSWSIAQQRCPRERNLFRNLFN